MSRSQAVCRCPAYDWPHRRRSGLCIWNPVHDEPRCSACGRECKTWRERALEAPHKYTHFSECCKDLCVVGGAWMEDEA